MENPKIVYEDSDILVVYKPPGMVVNKADTTKNVLTLQEWAEGYLKSQGGSFGEDKESEFARRGGVVHRLDKETSGILILAKNEESFVSLQTQFKSREVKKTYIALCHGRIAPPEGEIDVPIGRLPWNRTRFGILPQERPAKTQNKIVILPEITRKEGFKTKKCF